MEHHHDEHPRQPVSAEDWDERYSGEHLWSGQPNQALVAEVAGLPRGRALDVGCGEGADSVWLAQQGFRVTALDISPNAVARTRRAAEAAGVEVEAIAAPFLEAPLEGTFSLVSAMYPVLLRSEGQDAERRLAALVAPGGTLLFVHHEVDHEALSHGFDPALYLSPGVLADFLAGDDAWRLDVDERRPRHVATGQGSGHSIDLVLRATRLG